jgi:hypothetical protein
VVENLANSSNSIGFRCAVDEVESVATPMPTSPLDPDVLYQDDFTNPASGWPDAEFGNFLIGYHEPEYYHIVIKTAHVKAPVVSIPDPATHNYSDATIELVVQTVSGRTATDGDYRYGLVFRQTGDNYYAFTISPTTKKWEVLKSSRSVLAVLKEGVDENIHDLDLDDLLRVDAQGSNFLFSINDRLVGQVTDTDFPEGTVGLYAENIENTNTHVHFNTLTVREVNFSMTCTIPEGGTVYVRSGPSQTFPQIGVLSGGDTVQALGISSNQWIQIVVEGSDEPGWVSFFEGFITCTPSVDLFPIVSP